MSTATKRAASDLDDDAAAPAKLMKKSSWQEFSNTDPLYALFGEVGEDKVMLDDGELKEATLERYLTKLIVDKAAKKPKDWIEVWARMDIPVQWQAKVLTPIVSFGLQYTPPGGLGCILAELLKGHRVKTKAVEEALQATLGNAARTEGVLVDMLFVIFPKSPHSEWGWSRVGWSWQEWWKMVEKSLSCLEPTSAFDELGLLLDKIEAAGCGKPLSQQTQIWTEPRLAKVRSLLCKFGGLEDEEELLACLDARVR
eukprot:TRINITY_DN14251_c0_g3_i1.p1 TRINITY_DN14251_c0_g3~~TRINITY_DN14251_c0_g3_i1.p1  ORF type:complete len:266 (-),score=62.91 TRINITY_DN14251_c0_g3_i1:47-811(-)